MIDRHRRRNSNSNAIFSSNPTNQRDVSQRNIPNEDKPILLEKSTKDLEKKMSDLRAEVHYYFK